MNEIAAAYNDGKTASTAPVTLRLNGNMLDIIGPNGATVASWPCQDVHSVATGGDGQERRLRRGFAGAERLTLKNREDLKRLAPHCPRIGHTTPRSFGYWKPAIIMSAVAVASVFILIKVIVPALAQQIVNATPPEFENKLGLTAEQQIIAFFAWKEKKSPKGIVCRGKDGNAALNTLAQRLTRQMEPPLTTHITVINHAMVNAFALPGGRILIFNGLIQEAKKGNDLAGVLAHEIGHQFKRHPLLLAFETAGTSTLASLFFGDVSGGVVLGGLSQTLIDSSYQRDKERQADTIAITLLNRAGIDGSGMAEFFLRMGKEHGDDDGVMAYLSSHPGSRERSSLIKSQSTGNKRALSPELMYAVRKICD